MSINPSQLRELIIRPVLQSIGLHSPAAEDLLCMTAAWESNCGEYVAQVGGPALGIFQMEPATLQDLGDNWLAFRMNYRDTLERMKPISMSNADALVMCNAYATAACRLQYYRQPEPLPGNIDDLAQYAKTHWNGPGKATPEDYAGAYRKYFS